jgi:pyruvate/2-oxoglutarate dehydrogenase complex dihydrolipoamide acyltransferase (E2) component
MAEFKLPDLGEGVTEAEVDRWLVKEGDTIAEDDPLVELITDKATAEVPSPFAGVVSKIHVEAGSVVPVGTVLVTIDSDSEAPSPAGSSPQERTPNVSDSSSPVLAPSDSASSHSFPLGEAQSAAAREDSPSSQGREGNGVKAMPPVRRLARELEVDLASVVGSGPDGSILRSDVIGAAAGKARGAAAAPSGDLAGGRREALRGVRRVIAERMSQAHRVVPPVTHVEECDVTELEATRNLANDRAPDQPRLTFLPFIVKAVVQGLKDHPALNATLDEDAAEIVYHDHYDIGVAVDTPSGLVVPVIHDADKKRLREIATEIDRLAQGARAGTLGMSELRGGTFTVTSPGPFGGLMATPIVFHPQAAILGVHRATERAVVRDGQIVARKMMNLSITFDHRILDGMTAARFALDVVKLLEHPAVLALEA